MKTLPGLTFFISGLLQLWQVPDLHEIRHLYSRAPLVKADAQTLDKLLAAVDSSAAPVLYCYKGAAEMIEAKYALNPVSKLERFNRGKDWIQTAIRRDTLALEMRFIRYSIQSNLPAFLNYHAEMDRDKFFLQAHVGECPDAELKKMVTDYLALKPNNH